MGAFGGFTLTNKGRNLQAKAQAGAVLNYTRAAIGDGTLTGQSIVALTALISPKKTLLITKLRMIPPDRAAVGTIISNQSITTGFYFREIGIFAQDPDEGEILYAYANSGANAEYLPPTGGPDVIEKSIDMLVVVGRASQVTATIDSSLVFPTFAEMEDAIEEALASVKVPLVDSNTSTSKTEAPTADALRRTVESMAEALALKQNVLRLADNWLPAAILINGTVTVGGVIRSYPDGVSMFKVSTSADGWPASNGYVLTFRAGSGGYQIFYEMYVGAVQTDKTARQWTRSKRDSNGFWQDWARGLTEVDLKLADNYKAPTAAITEYPEGRSVFFVGGGTGGQGAAWSTAAGATEQSGFVETIRTGNAGYQTFTEMYSGTSTTDTLGNRQFKRVKRDSNSFWQPFEKIIDADDLTAHNADYVRQPGYAATAGTGAAYTVTLNPAPAALPDGLAITIVPHADNTAADPTLKIGSLAALPIRRQSGGQFAAGSIKAGQPLSLVKVGSYFLARSAAPTGNATAAQVLAGYTFSNDTDVGLTGTALKNVSNSIDLTTIQYVSSSEVYDRSIDIAILPPGTQYFSFVSKMENTTAVDASFYSGSENSGDGIFLEIRSGNVLIMNQLVTPTRTIWQLTSFWMDGKNKNFDVKQYNGSNFYGSSVNIPKLDVTQLLRLTLRFKKSTAATATQTATLSSTTLIYG